ncbi:Plasmodium exported protein (hyp15), unknown function [Plasmodium sp. gorilla clade G2]|uniref:Plasmodium exported protein (hyp15), unknown function n=1 Tax=Plasmodium sp. gorilla clade G2 TaxID=880535 RepID=UPI000D21D34F|nr:Plasmodium exported protein (hyp15), unknown function [Plasmodium sp. gorilla clade G2]SOV19987.1 Plasmodium exported protein (hyp15), unknown function [Plasmodium sp. gorilla clade G2]
MNFFYVKLFSLIFILRIYELFHTSNLNILKYKHKKHACLEKLKFVRSLSEVLKEKYFNTQVAECDLMYDKLQDDELTKHRNLINNTEIVYYNKRKKQRENKLQNKILRKIMEAYYKLKYKLIIDKSFGTAEYNETITHITKKNIMKDNLYKMIFKGKKFWKMLSYTIGTLGVGSSVCLFIGVPFSIVSPTSGPILFAVLGILVFLLIIIIVGVWILTTWLWPHKDSYYKKYRL